jgi:threonine/homoserine/homoserine lactone efflux protein
MGTHLLLALVVGAVMGFLGSMPIAGPVAVLVLERGLVGRGREGLGVALGAATAESIYAFLAFWGLGAVLHAAPGILPASRLVGAGVMVTLGIYLATRKSRPRDPAEAQGPEPAGRKRRGFLLGLSVTFLNPTIIASWTVVTATVHSTGWVETGLLSAIVFAGGVGTGIVGWFTTMLRLLRRFQRGLRPETVDRVLHVTGWLVVAIGIGLGVRPFGQALGWFRP